MSNSIVSSLTARIKFILLVRAEGAFCNYQIPTTWDQVKDLQFVVHNGQLFKYSEFRGPDAIFHEVKEVFFNPAE